MMRVHDIAFLELFVEDRDSVADYFTRSWGFATTARHESVQRASVLLQHADVRLIVTSGPAAQTFVARHGDGVADIAFTCDDVPDAIAAACAAGAARLGRATVSGIGDMRHTLVDKRSYSPSGPPDERGWQMCETQVVASRPGHISLLDHVALCVASGTLGDVARLYRNGFGLETYSSEYVEVGDQAMDSIVLRSSSGNVTFTILEPDSGKSQGQIDAFLERNGGGGVQHLAFLVDDIVSAVRDFRQRGVEFLSTPDAYYASLVSRIGEMAERIADLRETNVLADRDEWGYILQLFTRSPHPRNTLFYELIQRAGGQGFGSANIRALYESVERERMTA